ncbi:MAG: hypothetical protein H6686_00355 [Fibrobacteria bacterium]|nr:hypothetical protein [Fibrobacteria bacterium]
MDLQTLPLEALEAELKRRRFAQLGELKARIREHEQSILGLEQELSSLGEIRPETRRRKARS